MFAPVARFGLLLEAPKAYRQDRELAVSLAPKGYFVILPISRFVRQDDIEPGLANSRQVPHVLRKPLIGTEAFRERAGIEPPQDRFGFVDHGDSGSVVFWTADLVTGWPVGLLKSLTSAGYGVASPFAAVLSAWAYNFAFKRTWLSWLPYALSFGLLPAFLSYGGLGGGLHGGPPTLAMTVLAALLGIGIHFLNTLPDLVEDNETGIRHLPLRIALRIGAPKLLWISTIYTFLVAAGIVVAALTGGLRQ